MNYKYEPKLLLAYTQAFVDKVNGDYFETHKQIRGEQIKTFTSIKQVNYFNIRYVYESWHGQINNFYHPYFDYTHPDVQKSFYNFMNILSKNISIEEKYFKVLMKKATMDTLTLMFFPNIYFQILLGKYENTIHIKRDLLPTLKYIKIHVSIVESLKVSIERYKEISKTHLYQKIEEIISKNSLDNLEKIIKNFDETAPLNISEVVPSWKESFNDQESKTYQEPNINSNIILETENNIKDLLKDVQKVNDLQSNTHSESVDKRETIEKPIVNLHTSDKKKTKKISLLDRLQNNENQINNAKISLLDKIQKQNKSLKKSISIADRERFCKLLFKGETQSYNSIIELIEQSANYEEAMSFVQNYLRDYQWDITKEITKDFLNYINNFF